jgi:hypothetical protein
MIHHESRGTSSDKTEELVDGELLTLPAIAGPIARIVVCVHLQVVYLREEK